MLEPHLKETIRLETEIVSLQAENKRLKEKLGNGPRVSEPIRQTATPYPEPPDDPEPDNGTALSQNHVELEEDSLQVHCHDSMVVHCPEEDSKGRRASSRKS